MSCPSSVYFEVNLLILYFHTAPGINFLNHGVCPRNSLKTVRFVNLIRPVRLQTQPFKILKYPYKVLGREVLNQCGELELVEPRRERVGVLLISLWSGMRKTEAVYKTSEARACRRVGVESTCLKSERSE